MMRLLRARAKMGPACLPRTRSGTPGLVLRVDAVKPTGCMCQVVSVPTPTSPLSARPGPVYVSAGARLVHAEYQSEQDEMVLIGLLAMVRWRLIELDRQGKQVVDTVQLLDMAVTVMLGRSSRSLYTPVHYLSQHASERTEKAEASRQMVRRCARGETTELDRLKVRELLLPSIIQVMNRYGVDARSGQYSHLITGVKRSGRRVQLARSFAPHSPEPPADASAEPAKVAVGVAAAALPAQSALHAAASFLPRWPREQPQSPAPADAASSSAATASIDRKLDAVLEALVATRSEQQLLRRQLERMEARMGLDALAPDTWDDALADGNGSGHRTARRPASAGAG
jgi:hypothetical protein